MTDETAEKSIVDQNIERMDKICSSLLDLIENPETPAKLKPTLFSQVQQWYKVRDKVIPDKRGNRLEEMANERNDAQRGGSGKPGKPKKPRAAPTEGRAIRDLIKRLPTQPGNNGRDTAYLERSGGGSDGDGWGIPVNGGGDVAGNQHGPLDSPVV